MFCPCRQDLNFKSKWFSIVADVGKSATLESGILYSVLTQTYNLLHLKPRMMGGSERDFRIQFSSVTLCRGPKVNGVGLLRCGNCRAIRQVYLVTGLNSERSFDGRWKAL